MIQNVGRQSNAALAPLKLFEVAADLRQEFKDTAKLFTLPESDDDSETENAPLFLSFVLEQANAVSSCRKLTNFNRDELQNLQDLLHDSNALGIFSGRRRKCMDSLKDILFMLSVVLKHEEKRTFFAAMFKKNISTFEMMMTRLVVTIVTELGERFRSEVRYKLCSMSYLFISKKQFAHFPSALYATDVKFHHACRSQGTQQESKLYYSGRHHLYCYRTGVLVFSSGFAVHASKHRLGSRADISIIRAGREQHAMLLQRTGDDESV